MTEHSRAARACTNRRRTPCRCRPLPPGTAARASATPPPRASRPIVRVTVTSALLIGAVAGCVLAVEPVVRELLDTLLALAGAASRGAW